jgi:hypothetical protein
VDGRPLSVSPTKAVDQALVVTEMVYYPGEEARLLLERGGAAAGGGSKPPGRHMVQPGTLAPAGCRFPTAQRLLHASVPPAAVARTHHACGGAGVPHRALTAARTCCPRLQTSGRQTWRS